jgi:hypothetical protein
LAYPAASETDSAFRSPGITGSARFGVAIFDDAGRPNLDKHSAVLGLVQDEPALRAGAASGILDKTLRAALCRRQVGSEEWSS